jgi:hypothetical protein
MQVMIAGAIAGLLLAASAAAQATIAGKWEGQTPGGSAMVLDLAVKGDVLTGTLTRQGAAAPLSDGKVSKESFTFKAKVNDSVEGFSGERAGADLKVWLDRQGRDAAVTFKRVKGGDAAVNSFPR